ncbi:MAG: TonB-dependent receptor plug domain-containing protein, partial [Terriglobia bacterium]
ALSPGAVTSVVTVTAGAVAVETKTSGLSHEVESGQLNNLPLNGRNYQGLLAMSPGVINTSGGTALGTGGNSSHDVLEVNGLGWNQVFYVLDGIPDTNSGNNRSSSVTPNPDMLEEVRILQNNYSTKYSLLGEAVIVMQTKSGTQAFHGGAFEYVRNTDFNARNFFAPGTSTATVLARPTYHQNIFGYDIGGPLYIPGVYNTNKQKTFFFVDQQWVRLTAPPSSGYLNGVTATSSEYTAPFEVPSTKPIHVPGASSCFYPSMGALAGDAAATVYQLAPAGGVSALTGTGCPTSLPAVNTSSTAFLKALYPAPNYASGGATNYENLMPYVTHQLDSQIKIDHNFSSRFHLMGEYFREYQAYKQYSLGTSPLNWEEDYTRNSMAQVALTATLSPSMVSTTSVAFNIWDVYSDMGGIDYVNQIPGFSETLPYNGYLSNRIPRVSFSSTGWSLFTEGIKAGIPTYHSAYLNDTLSEDWSWLKGKHYLQAGINILLTIGRANQAGGAGGTMGTWSFSGTYTGNSLADFLLGDAATFGQGTNQIRGYSHQRIVSPYVEDRIQVTKRLTVTAGLRFWNMPWGHSQAGMGSMFMPSHFVAANAPVVTTGGSLATPLPTGTFYTNGLVIGNGLNGVPLNFMNSHNWYTGPMAGFAWDVFGDGKTSLRGGLGLTYTVNSSTEDCSFACLNNPPFVGSTALTGNTANPLSFPTPGASGTVSPNNGLESLSSADPNLKAWSFLTYSLSLQHQFRKNWLVMIAGAGSAARNSVYTYNANTPPPTTVNGVHYDFNPNINPPNDYSPSYYAPYQGYGSISDYFSDNTSNWNALEVTVRHPVSHNVFFTAAYTWSHELGEGSDAPNIYNLEENYGNFDDSGNGDNFPQTFMTTLTYNLPWFRHSKGIAGQTLGGWKFSDMTTWRTGDTFSAELSGSNLGPNGRPNIVNHNFYPATRTVTHWLNSSAFAAPAAGYYGNEPYGCMETPRLSVFDMAVNKEFHLYERLSLEFRAEAFNVFNHTNFKNPDIHYAGTTFGVITAAYDPRIMEFALRLKF